MANNLAIGLIIGAALSSGFKGTFGSAKQSVESLGQAISKSQKNHQKLGSELGNLRQKQAKLYAEMSRASSKGGLGLALMKTEYDKIARKISQVKAKQQEYTKAIEKSIQTQGKLQKAINFQERNNNFRENQKSKFTSNFVKGTAIAATGTSVMNTFIEQENAATDLKIAMMKADGSFGEFDKISKIAKELGRDLPGTTKDFYRLSQALKKQGVSDKVLTGGALKTSAELNVLLDMDQQAGGEFLAKFMESHRLDESELPQAADYLQRAMFAGGLSKEQMYESMKYYAPKLNSMKLTGAENTEKILAIEAMAGQQGLEGSTFGTGLNMMLSRMNKGPKMIRDAKKGMKAEARDMMESVGVEFNFWDKKGSFKGVDGMLAEMQKFEKIRKKYGDEGVGLVAEELFGIEGGRLADILAQKGAKGLDEMIAKMREQASLQERIKLKTATLSSALESLGGVWENAVGSLGSVFAGDIKAWANSLQDGIEKYTPLIEQNKELIKTVAGVVAGFIGFKLFFSGAAVALSSLISPIASIYTGFQRFQALTSAFRLWKTSKDFSAFGNAIRKVGSIVSSSARSIANSFRFVARSALNIGRTLGGSLVRGVMMTGRAFATFGRVLGGALVRGLVMAGRAFMVLGRAFLTNPIGIAITVIAGLAYLLWDNWDWVSEKFSQMWQWIGEKSAQCGQAISDIWNGVTTFFSGVWENITTFFNSGIGNITATILNWSPLGLFYQAFSSVLSWFGIDLPAKFTEFGSNLISGLVNGIRNAWDGAKEWVIGLGQSIKGWFTGEMKIHSPSRVFKGYGENIVSGLAIGIAENALQATQAVDKMGKKVNKAAPKNVAAPAIKAPKMPTVEPLVAKSAVKFEPVLNSVETAFKPLLNEKKGFLGTLWDDVKFGANFVGNLLGLNQLTDFRTPNFNPDAQISPNPSLQKRETEALIFRDYQPLNRNAVTNNETNQHNGIVVNFNPTINVNGSQNQGVLEQFQQGMQMNLYELEKAIERIMDQKMRRAY
ncbi:phage tail tape measure protein [Haemophilus parahaemolyticus]